MNYSSIVHLEKPYSFSSISSQVDTEILKSVLSKEATLNSYMRQIDCDLAHRLEDKYHADFVYFNYSLSTYSHVLNKGMGCLL